MHTMTPADAARARLLLTTPEVADMLHISPRTAWELVRSGRLRSIRIGRSVRIPMSAVQEFIELAAR